MAFFQWFKNQVEAKPAAAGAPPVIGKATETVAIMLEEQGRYAIDLDPTEAAIQHEQFQIWAKHVRTGSAVPGLSGTDQRKRHWQAVQKFFAKHRRDEQAHVSANLRDLRELLWTFIKTTSQSLGNDQMIEGTVIKQLARLKTALEGNSIESIKREALPALTLLSRITNDRRTRQGEELKQLGQKLKELRGELDHARKLLEIDALTRLYNRRAFDQQLSRIANISIFAGKPTTLMMLDIDHFKSINDTYGHPGGDAVLKALSDLFIDSFPRKSDFVARYGGEEFAIILQEDGAEIANRLAQKLVDKVRATEFKYEGKRIPLTISVGIAEYIGTESAEAWTKRADTALYQAKENGRDRVSVSGENLARSA